MKCSRSLSRRVLCAARDWPDGTWSARVMGVAGENMDYEIECVLLHGSDMDEEAARALFPALADKTYRPSHLKERETC